MSGAPELVLLTDAYPFGSTSEPFLDAELEILAERFPRIYLLPSRRDEGGPRTLPANAELVEMDWLNEPLRATRRRALVSREALRVLFWTFPARDDLRSHLGSRLHLDILARNVLKARSLARFARERRLRAAIFYDYWFENSTLALALVRHSGGIQTAISRAHRFDIYDEDWDGRPVPFRAAKAQGLDAVFAVSEFGAGYLTDHVPALRGKVRIARLGVPDPGRTSPKRTEATPLIVSCASLIARKRVHLIPEVLSRLSRQVRWIHLGDGPERGRVEEAASRCSDRVNWRLAGRLDHTEILGFYARHHVDAFVSLSRSEGLPVSMMEAQSYGVPVVACGVHGVPEIVNNETGVLLAQDASPPEIAAGLASALEPGRFDLQEIRAHFRRRFEARTNYDGFASVLIELHAGTLAA